MLNDPFQTGRDASRLLFDFSIATSFFDFNTINKKVLDFACGTGWTSEFLNKLGFDIYGFDLDDEAIKLAKQRYQFDQRIHKKQLHFTQSDGHHLPYTNNFFSHTFCFDSFHHMSDFRQVLTEINRVLDTNGLAIFVEPGSKHSDSLETKKFLINHPHGDYWIEKSVDLLEIYNLSKTVGFDHMIIKPLLYPSTVNYTFTDWYNIMDNIDGQKNLIQELRRFNYEDRVIFSITKTK